MDAITNIFGMPEMDTLHTYDTPESNVRYYHRRKALVVRNFIKKNASGNNVFLDAGAGRGPYSLFAAPLYRKIFLYEYSAEELEIACKHIGYLKNIETKQVDLTKIPLPDASVDIAVCSEVLEHIPHEYRAMAELMRVMHPGGKLLLSMPNAFSLFYARVRLKQNHRDILNKLYKSNDGSKKSIVGTPDEAGLTHSEWEMIRHISFPFWKIERLAKQAGFEIVSRRGVNVFPIPSFLRIFFIRRFPLGLYLWTMKDRLFGRIIPQLGSFYFLELRVPRTSE